MLNQAALFSCLPSRVLTGHGLIRLSHLPALLQAAACSLA